MHYACKAFLYFLSRIIIFLAPLKTSGDKIDHQNGLIIVMWTSFF